MPCRTVVLVSALFASTACHRAPSTALLPPAASSGATAPSPGASAPVLTLPSATASPALLAQAPPASSPPAVAAPAPHVRVENIGMHIGGGPNDAVHKAPIAESVARHLDEVRACWTQAADPTRGGDFGVDLLIPREGGKATVSHPRTSIHPEAFRDCVVAVLEQVDFRAPAQGRTTVSYSLRFTP